MNKQAFQAAHPVTPGLIAVSGTARKAAGGIAVWDPNCGCCHCPGPMSWRGRLLGRLRGRHRSPRSKVRCITCRTPWPTLFDVVGASITSSTSVPLEAL